MKKMIISMTLIYILFFIIGIVLHSENIFGEIRETALLVENKNFFYYFAHNINVLKNSLVGIFSFGIFSILQLTINGIFLGVGMAEMTANVGWLKSLLFIFPHGFFEIPALILSTMLGIYPVYLFCLLIFKNKNYKWKVVMFKQAKNIFWIFMTILIFIIIAALLEAYLTPWLIKNYV